MVYFVVIVWGILIIWILAKVIDFSYYIDKIKDYIKATPEERKKRREYEKDVKELMKKMEGREASAQQHESSGTHYRRGCGTFEFEANKSFARKSAEKIVSAYSNFIKNNKFAYATRNKYCKYDGLILITFLARNHLITETEETVSEFTSTFFDCVIHLVASWYPMDIKEAREMFYNRATLYDEIFRKPDRTYEQKIESCIWELTQLVKYDIAYESYQEYSSSSPLLITGFNEDQLIEVEVFNLLKNVLEKL